AINVDGAGVAYLPHESLAAVAEVANRPVVIDVESSLGHGATGGFLARPGLVGEETARIVLRILNGESPSAIPITHADFIKPMFDGRQLQRFGISENQLPPGSEVRFRSPSVWVQHRNLVIAALVLFALQTAVAGALLIERRHRRRTEALLKDS